MQSALRRRSALLVGLATLLLAGGLACSQEGGDASAGVGTITAETLLSSPPADALVLDVRSREEFASGHVPGATNIPHGELADRLGELGSVKDRALVVYCESGRRAGMAQETLLASGFTKLLHLEGDMKAWRAAGRVTE